MDKDIVGGLFVAVLGDCVIVDQVIRWYWCLEDRMFRNYLLLFLWKIKAN